MSAGLLFSLDVIREDHQVGFQPFNRLLSEKMAAAASCFTAISVSSVKK